MKTNPGNPEEELYQLLGTHTDDTLEQVIYHERLNMKVHRLQFLSINVRPLCSGVWAGKVRRIGFCANVPSEILAFDGTPPPPVTNWYWSIMNICLYIVLAWCVFLLKRLS